MPIRLLLALLLSTSVFAAKPPFPGEKSEWHGFDRYDFEVDGRAARVVVPTEAAPGTPWAWRARWWGHNPQAEIALLEHGFHLVYIDVVDLFGAPVAVEIGDAFYAKLTSDYGFHPQPVLIGQSRGGLMIYNWAKANPDKVACIYGDAPVCDIRSWPRDRSGPGNWAKCKAIYDLTEEEAETAEVSPIHGLEPLAAAGVPLLHVVGDADRVVPVAENSDVLVARYRALGGHITVIHKPGIGHQPHCLEDPEPIVRFILQHTIARHQ